MCNRPGSVRGHASPTTFSVGELLQYRTGLAAWAQIQRVWLARQPRIDQPHHRFILDETEQLLNSLVEIDTRLRLRNRPFARDC